ncbi:MAG: tRNA (adenosine(37)-N6)-threonylcarbamoyltransferase complex ATPase subunit type 1 TsaE [Bowdeniella nasicola]|nr:tRNA (adenosine(37)-N6)-threonylcarbamoyltransferase complex ATPase subunit type 1 TsaE [Bowdeniella nasicola]
MSAKDPESIQWTLPEAEDMRDLGRALAEALQPGDILVLTGDLGAGKTTFTQGLGQGLGVRGRVTSPTFTISRIHPHPGAGPNLVHVDAYRVSDCLDLETVDLESTAAHAVTVIEWGEALIKTLTPDYFHLTFARAAAHSTDSDLTGAEGVRTVCLRCVGAAERDFSAILPAAQTA